MAELGYTEVKEKGHLVGEFARAFKKEMERSKVRIKEVIYDEENISYELSTLHFTKGSFHAVSYKGDLMYKCYMNDNQKKFWKIWGVMFLFALIGIPFWLWWNDIIGIILTVPCLICLVFYWYMSYAGKPELEQVMIALAIAEKLIIG